MDATRVMTTAALGVAMATLFAPPLGALMSSHQPKAEPKLMVEAIASPAVARNSVVCAPVGAVAQARAATRSRLAQVVE